ncbi:MAG: hypothetical protein JWM83_1370, partial [Candidatus Angelobacter sp.]|nr:hypothetical protein [Candidatus Angelobacter sp.]
MMGLDCASAGLQHYCATYQPELQNVTSLKHFLSQHCFAKRLSAVLKIALWFRKIRAARFPEIAPPHPAESLSSSVAASCLGHSPDAFPASVDSTHAHQLSITCAHPHSRVRHDSPLDVHSGLLSADDPVTLSRFLDDPRFGFESCALALSVSSTNFLSNSSSDDARPCLVCERAPCNSCPVCEQDFCETHLYRCADCGNRFCSNCLDDHRSDGHWTDSDT